MRESLLLWLIIFLALLLPPAILADTTAPTISIAGPIDEYYSTTGVVTFEYTPVDANPINNCILTLDPSGSGTNLTSSNGGISNNSANTFTRTMLNGTWNWTLSCQDNASNIGYSSTRTLTVNLDTIAPRITPSVPNTTADSSGVSTFYYTPIDDESGVNECFLSVDGVLKGSDSTISNGSSNSFGDIQLSAGDHTWYVNCTDYRNNSALSSPASLFVEVSDSTTTIVLNSPANAITDTDGLLTFNYTPSSPNKIISCVLLVNGTINDSDSSIEHDVPNVFRNIRFRDDSWTWGVSCIDNQSSKKITSNQTFIVDTLASQSNFISVILKKPVDGSTSSAPTQDFSYNVSSLNTLSYCELITNSSTRATHTNMSETVINTFEAVDLSNGVWAWQVRCVDEGNDSFLTLPRTLTVDAPIEAENPPEDENATVVSPPLIVTPSNATGLNETATAFSKPAKIGIGIVILLVLLGVFLLNHPVARSRIQKILEAQHFQKHHAMPAETDAGSEERLKKYVRTFLKKGYNKQYIIRQLRQYEWDDAQIDRVFYEVEQEMFTKRSRGR